ncbi:hypothetical protein IGI04_012374 [Brassica rapa subsp. trilocularis]|uniref:DUF4005 domain-containing protein n=1 Tax=Brassica rapa subsp. trilocularis TaxID=1813537 RepID=A0ABQ7N851_BRACM|nr:hypothetical protein IGI04_012374 [Brassica rapa subsp. trilocularis]
MRARSFVKDQQLKMESTSSPSLQATVLTFIYTLRFLLHFSLTNQPKAETNRRSLPTWPTPRDCLALCGGTFSGDLPAASPPFAHQSNKPLERTLPPLKSKLSSEARRAFRALKSLVKLQAVARGVLVRRQARIALHCMHALARLQVRVRARQILSH